jgi:hypothetical protein
MRYFEEFSKWLKGTWLSWAMLHYTWVWPACQIIHFIGLVLLIGIVGLFDMRVLGIGKGLSMGLLHKLLPLGIAGFALNLVTGALFYTGDPFQYIHNPAFQLKILFIVLSGLNAIYFYAAGVHAKVEAAGPADDAPLQAKIVAGISLTVWVAVMYLGRMLPFLGDSTGF